MDNGSMVFLGEQTIVHDEWACPIVKKKVISVHAKLEFTLIHE